MCSNSSGWQPPPPPAIVSCAAPAAAPMLRPVWVLLEVAYQPDPDRVRRMVADGLDLTGRARGFLVGEWLRSARGEFLGRVNVAIGYADPARAPTMFREQLMPARALQPRNDGRPL